jgi:hypothetical protein
MRATHRPRRRGFPCTLVLALVLAAAGCSSFHSSSAPPRADVKSLSPTTKEATKTIELDVLENQVMRFADSYVATVSQAVDDFNALPTTTPEARAVAVRWKLSQATIAYVNATGANPVLNVLDMVVFVTISRMVMEDEIDRILGQGAQPLLEAHRRLEADVWGSVSRVLKPGLQQDLRAKIQEWHENNPHQRYVAAARLRELAAALGVTSQAKSSGPNSVFRMLYLDPLAGLDPTAAAIQETRRLAERAMYYAQRMPTLLNWQAEYLSLELARQPETKQVLADVERLTRSFESYAKVADQLPQLVNDQRQAAIQQVFDGLSAEEPKTRALLSETRQTLDAGRETAAAINTAVQSIHMFVQSVKPPADTNVATPASAVARRPFDVLDYGQAASQIGVAAQQLNTLAAMLDKTAPQISAQSKELVDYTFRRVLWALAVTLVGIVLASLAYRSLASRLFRNGTKRNRVEEPNSNRGDRQ